MKNIFLYLILFLSFCQSIHCSEKKVALVVRPEWYGELEFGHKLQKACHNLGWQANIVDFEETLSTEYDFAITLVPFAVRNDHIPNYLAIFHPAHNFFDANGYLLSPYHHHAGYLLTYPLGKHKKDFKNEQKFPYMNWYPTSHRNDYVEVNPTKLFYLCCSWGNRTDTKYQGLIKYLNKKSYAELYGPEKFRPLCPKKYLGRIPIDGQSVINKIQDAGVALIMHSDDHLKAKLPSGRIFEAAASSAVIICDENEFVKEHFGDSVLYVDQNATNKKFYKSIDQAMKWIQKNKGAALEKAQRAHEIFSTKFLLEDQLLRLEEFHDRLQAK